MRVSQKNQVIDNHWYQKVDDVADTEAAEVRKSPIAGTGVFAKRNIRKGEVVLPLTGKKLHESEISDVDRCQSLLQIEEDVYLMATGTIDDFLNHSCDPNLGFTPDGQSFFALRDIAKEEELSWDYSSSDNDPEWAMKCLCGSPRCRGTVAGFPALDQETRRRLLPIAQPYLRRLYGSQ
jgi:SET domain-containing protein